MYSVKSVRAAVNLREPANSDAARPALGLLRWFSNSNENILSHLKTYIKEYGIFAGSITKI